MQSELCAHYHRGILVTRCKQLFRESSIQQMASSKGCLVHFCKIFIFLFTTYQSCETCSEPAAGLTTHLILLVYLQKCMQHKAPQICIKLCQACFVTALVFFGAQCLIDKICCQKNTCLDQWLKRTGLVLFVILNSQKWKNASNSFSLFSYCFRFVSVSRNYFSQQVLIVF